MSSAFSEYGCHPLFVELETKVHTKVRNHGEGPYFLLIIIRDGQL